MANTLNAQDVQVTGNLYVNGTIIQNPNQPTDIVSNNLPYVDATVQNTFTALQTFNSGIKANTITTTGTSFFNKGIEISGTVTIANGILYMNNNNIVCANGYGIRGTLNSGSDINLLKIDANDTIALGNTPTSNINVYGILKGTSSSVLQSSAIKDYGVNGSTGGISFSSGGNASRRLFIGLDADWNGGRPPGLNFGDIWIWPGIGIYYWNNTAWIKFL